MRHHIRTHRPSPPNTAVAGGCRGSKCCRLSVDMPSEHTHTRRGQQCQPPSQNSAMLCANRSFGKERERERWSPDVDARRRQRKNEVGRRTQYCAAHEHACAPPSPSPGAPPACGASIEQHLRGARARAASASASARGSASAPDPGTDRQSPGRAMGCGVGGIPTPGPNHQAPAWGKGTDNLTAEQVLRPSAQRCAKSRRIKKQHSAADLRTGAQLSPCLQTADGGIERPVSADAAAETALCSSTPTSDAEPMPLGCSTL